MILLSNYLEHHGIMGQKWGVRRYQPYSVVPRKSGKSGKMIGAAKKAFNRSGGSSNGKRSAKSNNNKDAYRPGPRKVSKEEKERIIRSGSIKDIKSISGNLDNRELREALDRVDLNRRLNAMDAATKSTGKQRIDKAFNIAKDVRSKTETAISLYNTGAKIYNTFADEPIRIIGGDNNKQVSKEVKNLINQADAKTVANNLDKLNASQKQEVMKRLNNERSIREKAEAQDKVNYGKSWTESSIKDNKELEELWKYKYYNNK